MTTFCIRYLLHKCDGRSYKFRLRTAGEAPKEISLKDMEVNDLKNLENNIKRDKFKHKHQYTSKGKLDIKSKVGKTNCLDIVRQYAIHISGIC